MFPRILNEISQNNWAILPESFSGILKGVSGGLTFADYSLFHKLDEEVKSTTLAFLGPRARDSRYTRIRGNIGSIFIDGPIIPRSTGFSDISGLTSIDALINEHLKLEANNDLTKILLVIDSPGGAVTGLSDYVQVIRDSKKEVIAINLGLMASAAYWIGSAADKIYSADTGLIGSIGTILSMPNPDDTETVIVSEQSPNKKMDVTTKQGRADAQRIVNELAAIFISSVAVNRGVKEKVILSQYGKGSVFVAEDALIRGMIDGVVFLRDYMAGSSIKTSIEGEPESSEAEEIETEKVGARSKNTKTTEGNEMSLKNLKEAIAENPAIGLEVKEKEDAARIEGAGAVQARVKRVVPFLESDTYSDKPAVRSLACRVLKGESDISALESAITVLDSTMEKKETDAAGKDTDKIGESNADAGEGGKTNAEGIVSSEADFQASLAAQKAQL